MDIGLNELYFRHGHGMFGTYIYTLYVDGEAVASKRMVFSQ